MAAAQGQPKRAARLFGAAEALCQQIGVSATPLDHASCARCADRVCDRLGQEAFGAAWDEGRAMPLEQTIAYALGEGEPPAESVSQLG